ncbi:MAG: hypothetical protein FWE09_06580 [Treponema sp.]|nr:hypothetical protein [Treponema sp.]
MKKILVLTALLACLAVAAQAQARPPLAILPFTGGSGGDGETIATLLSFQQEIRAAFIPVPRTPALDAIFAEHRFQLEGLTDADTLSQIGRMLNAQYVLSGTIRSLGDRNLVIATIIHVQSFQQVAGYYRAYRIIEEVRGFLPEMASSLIATARRDTSGLPNLAVMPMEVAGLRQADAETLAMILATEIVRTRNYAVLPRTSAIESALAEMRFGLQGYTATEGMSEIGRAFNAQMALALTTRSLGTDNMFTAQILRMNDGSQLEGDFRMYNTIADGVDLMGELAILISTSPGGDRDRRLMELQLRQGRLTPVPGKCTTDQLAWLRTNAVSNTNYGIDLNVNLNIPPQSLALPSGVTNVSITLRGVGGMRTISLSANGSLFTVGSGVTFVLDSSVTLQGRDGNNQFLVQVNSGGAMIMNANSGITGNIGGGVLVSRGGDFTMHGGTISNNQGNGGADGADGRDNYQDQHGTDGSAGGIGGVHNAGTFTMNDGIIIGNNGGNGGNGGNGATGNFNGGFHGFGGWGGAGGMGGIFNTGAFVMHGGIITDNNGGIGGRGGNGNILGSGGTGGFGGVYNEGSFTMYGGNISANIGGNGGNDGLKSGREGTGSRGGGGGSGGSSGAANTGTFAMYGGTIADNTGGNIANNNYGVGGNAGLSNLGGTVVMYGGIISGNSGSRHGSEAEQGVTNAVGGVNSQGGTFQISGGTIYGSNAEARLRNSSGVIGRISFGTFNANGVFTSNGTLATTTGTIHVENGVRR